MSTISSLSLPYRESPHTNVALHRLACTNSDGSAQIVFQIGRNKQCASIQKLNSVTKQLSDDALSYIDNKLPSSCSPLLLRVSPDLSRLKFTLSVDTAAQRVKSLVILKTLNDNNDIPRLIEQLKSDQGSTTNVEISQIKYSQLPLDDNTEETQHITINDSFDTAKFANGVLNVFFFEAGAQDYAPLFDLAVWVDGPTKQRPAPSPPEPKLTVKDYRRCIEFVLEDGPEFRKNITQWEHIVPQIMKNMTYLTNEINAMESNLRKLVNNKQKIIEYIQNLMSQSVVLTKTRLASTFKKRLNGIIDPFKDDMKLFFQVFDKKCLEKFVYLTNDDQELNFKKNFENESREFYNWLKKYLSNEKERPAAKLLAKRKSFELAKFAYLSHSYNHLNNQYSNQLLENVFRFCNSKTGNWEETDLLPYQKVYLNFLVKFNSEKLKLLQMIKSCKSDEELTKIIKHNALNVNSDSFDDSVVKEDNLNLVFTSNRPPTDEEDINYLVPIAKDDTEISGILYALGGKGKQGWHKEWVVIKNGELREYSDWRKGDHPINQPILIAICNIKPVHHDKRQNCFEIHTSQGTKHTFQATNENEMHKWINVFQNVKLALINDESMNAAMRKQENMALKLNVPALDRPLLSINDSASSPVSIQSDSVISKDYLSTVRSIPDSDNHICADCGTTEAVEWVSINYLVVLCIKCSSAHRSLGSHVSKIRSLKLDKFEHEVEALLSYTNNRLHNSYLEHELVGFNRAKLAYEARLNFAKDKYISKKFKMTVENLNDLLIKSVQRIEIEEVIKCIILGGDPNLTIQISTKSVEAPKIVTLFEYSLRKYLIVKDGDVSSNFFVISEFLLLNGHKLGKVEPQLDLTSEAIAYWRSKYDKLS